MRQNRIRKAMVLVALVFSATMALAQSGLHKVNWRNARITDVGACVREVRLEVNQNPETQQMDTVLVENKRFVWRSQGYDVTDIDKNPSLIEGTEHVEIPDMATGDEEVDEHLRSLRKGMRRVSTEGMGAVVGQSGNLKDLIFKDFHYNVFSFEYPSIDADGNPIMLSAMCACPPGGVKRINNIILGTHITITADRECPSNQHTGWDQKDWGMIFSLAAGNKLAYKSWVIFLRYIATNIVGTIVSMVKDLKNDSGTANFNYDLVIMPDYEGYGVSKDRAHPYLYQELTARQCLDGLLYGIALYESAPAVDDIRVPIRSNFRSMVTGYSQGGSVALACHRFIEQNGLQKDLHFVGSYCGDGPYDPMATLMYYMKEDLAGNVLEMPVVLPLIVKGMLDTNPYMTTHKAEEYFKPEFLQTGVMDWIADKEHSTDNIEDGFVAAHKNGNTIFNDRGRCMLRDVMNEKCYAYFKKVYEDNKDTYTSASGIPLPTHRGVMEDLHYALASNNITAGWKPSKLPVLFHSEDDPVVPYDNAKSVFSRMGVSRSDAWICKNKDHIDAGMFFFSQSAKANVVLFDGLMLNEMVKDICNRNY